MTEFSDAIDRHININPVHVHKADWGLIYKHPILPPSINTHTLHRKNLSAWKRVYKPDYEHYENMIQDNASYAYVALLHLCARNNISWVYFNIVHPLIPSLESFKNEWPEYDINNETGTAPENTTAAGRILTKGGQDSETRPQRL